jgi:hypothetical protein
MTEVQVDARKVGGTVQAAPSGVADVMAVAADKATADPTDVTKGFASKAEPFSRL